MSFPQLRKMRGRPQRMAAVVLSVLALVPFLPVATVNAAGSYTVNGWYGNYAGQGIGTPGWFFASLTIPAYATAYYSVTGSSSGADGIWQIGWVCNGSNVPYFDGGSSRFIVLNGGNGAPGSKLDPATTSRSCNVYVMADVGMTIHMDATSVLVQLGETPVDPFPSTPPGPTPTPRPTPTSTPGPSAACFQSTPPSDHPGGLPCPSPSASPSMLADDEIEGHMFGCMDTADAEFGGVANNNNCVDAVHTPALYGLPENIGDVYLVRQRFRNGPGGTYCGSSGWSIGSSGAEGNSPATYQPPLVSATGVETGSYWHPVVETEFTITDVNSSGTARLWVASDAGNEGQVINHWFKATGCGGTGGVMGWADLFLIGGPDYVEPSEPPTGSGGPVVACYANGFGPDGVPYAYIVPCPSGSGPGAPGGGGTVGNGGGVTPGGAPCDLATIGCLPAGPGSGGGGFGPGTGPGDGSRPGGGGGSGLGEGVGEGCVASDVTKKPGFATIDELPVWSSANPLDAIVKAVESVPTAFLNVVKWMWNFAVDAIVPGDRLFCLLNAVSAQLDVTPPFSWFGEALDTFNESISYTGAPALTGTMSFGLVSVPINALDLFEAVEPTLSPYRGIFAAIVYLAFVLKLAHTVESLATKKGMPAAQQQGFWF